MIDLLGKATMYEEEHQPVFLYLKPFSSEIHTDEDITIRLIDHAQILAVPLGSWGRFYFYVANQIIGSSFSIV